MPHPETLNQGHDPTGFFNSPALRKFRAEYGKSVTKDDIFHYCYAVLHDPVYRETYAINLGSVEIQDSLMS